MKQSPFLATARRLVLYDVIITLSSDLATITLERRNLSSDLATKRSECLQWMRRLTAETKPWFGCSSKRGTWCRARGSAWQCAALCPNSAAGTSNMRPLQVHNAFSFVALTYCK